MMTGQLPSIRSILASLAAALKRGRKPAGPEAFRIAFDRFKKVLDINNNALQIITDMGEKLGGDYLFDIIYLRNTYDGLKREMECSLRTFDELTGEQYPGLARAFEQIDSLIMQVLSEKPAAAGSFVLGVEEIPWGSSQSVGGKMSQLAEVKNQLGLNIPDGFVITTAAFREFVAFNRLESAIARVADAFLPDAELEKLQNSILHGAIPPRAGEAIAKKLNELRRRSGPSMLAIRSSAEEEDSTHSFAGQFRTMLGVRPEQPEVELAYRQVIASLFSVKAVSYQRQTGYDIPSMRMAVGCLAMIDPVASGVMYSTSPDGVDDTMLISAAWGLGESIVEAKSGADLYIVRKGGKPGLLRTEIGNKQTMTVAGGSGGTAEIPVPADMMNKACLSGEQVTALALQGMRIERHFGNARDIEWAIDGKGIIWILQARPLPVRENVFSGNQGKANDTDGFPVIAGNRGTIVQPGIGAGPVFLARKPSDVLSMPKGAVLVASHDSSLFAQHMPYVSAIITERGSQTSHMAAICRELRIPTIVNAPGIFGLLKQGQEVTVVAEEGKPVIYGGIARDLLVKAGQDREQMETVYEFRRKRYVLRYITPLHLIDPLMDEFVPERCRSLHDVIRFMHEKSVAELVETARAESTRLRPRGTLAPLDLPVPAGILIMDMGGGLKDPLPHRKATVDQIVSMPFKAIVRGMLHPGVWREEPIGLGAGDFLSSMMRMPDVSDAAATTAGYNVAVISADYFNMSIRFGYHFNMIDCYCSDTAKNNHIYFRFAGGATDLAKRSRRLELIARILGEFGFGVQVKGDLLVGRLAGLPRKDIEQVLEKTGRLIAYARQLDALLYDDAAIEWYSRRFLNGNYGLRGC